MLLAALLCVQLAIGNGGKLTIRSRADARDDARLAALVDSVAQANVRIPLGLRGYQAIAESEIAILVRTATDRENILQVEQLQSVLQWRATAGLDQRVVGYRAQSVTATISALTYFRRPWILPTLYGNRLQVAMSRDGGASPVPDTSLQAVHPFGPERWAYYDYGGGDTVEVLRADGRTIPVVRLNVQPLASAHGPALLFRGELDIDASRFQVVRMRGELVRLAGRDGLARRLRHLVVQREVFLELENGEFAGRYWLPTFQRVEAQVRSPLASSLRPIVRVVTRFRRHRVDEASANELSASGDSVDRVGVSAPTLARLTRALGDSGRGALVWQRAIGVETARARGSDFDDVAPDAWRSRGAPRLDFHADHLSDVFRFNRVEGTFTGWSATLRLRDRLPGSAIGATGGYAWSERSLRGTAFARLTRGLSRFDLSLSRQLANTNDFRPTVDFESSIMAALVTSDDYDYFDRRGATVSFARAVGGWERLQWWLETGPVVDRSVSAHVRYGLIHPDSVFRPNRAIDDGSGWRSAVSVVFHPNVSGDMLAPGVGAALRYERGDGSLAWQRVDGRLVGRQTLGALSYAARFDVAAAFGAPAPRQQLIEFGENEGLPGYLYKEFGGDRAALLRGNVAYALPVLHGPLRVVRGLVLPPFAPSLVVGVQSGWAGASNATLAQLARLGSRRDPVTHQPLVDVATGRPLFATRPTDGIRSTLGISARLFGGAIAIGMARALDHRAQWQLTLATGQGL